MRFTEKGFIYLHVTVIDSIDLLNTSDTLNNIINSAYLAFTVSLVVW